MRVIHDYDINPEINQAEYGINKRIFSKIYNINKLHFVKKKLYYSLLIIYMNYFSNDIKTDTFLWRWQNHALFYLFYTNKYKKQEPIVHKTSIERGKMQTDRKTNREIEKQINRNKKRQIGKQTAGKGGKEQDQRKKSPVL